MSRLFEILKVRPGEERISMLLAGLMLCVSAGSAIGGNATEALFFARFGVELLPIMYIILGLFTFSTTLAITALMGRIGKQSLYTRLPLVLGFMLIGEWLVIPLNFKWFFAVMWLGMNVIGTLQGLLTWGLAGAVCDTRQAKRLFPLFSAGGILGTVLGGLITPLLAARLHSENLLLLWAAAMMAVFVLGRALIARAPVVTTSAHSQPPGIVEEMLRGYQFVRRSPILQWVSYSAILFSVCYFSLALPFSRGATAQFPDADLLAGFLGLFQSLSTGAALLASLFLANRLFARFGILPMLLVFPVIYLVGFGALAVTAPFALLVGARFAQMAYMNGIAGTSWQALFNVVPPEQRDQVRAFVGGVPEQAGTFIAGLILLVGEQALQPQQLYLVGLGAAILLVYIIARANQAYAQALVMALRAGQPLLFFSEEEPFGGLRSDAAAVAVAMRGLSDPDAATRRGATEIVGHLTVPAAAAALTRALLDKDVPVRVSALQGLARSRAAAALLEIAACLSDPEAEVRYAAIAALRQLATSPRGIVMHVEPLLVDSDARVRAQAALTLLRLAGHARARETLVAMMSDPDLLVRARALDALGEGGDPSAFTLTVSALDDPQPVVRNAACRALAKLNPSASISHLIQHLDDEDTSVRLALAESLGKIGEPALEPLLEVLHDPAYEDGALMALSHLPTRKAALKIRAYAKSAAQIAIHHHKIGLGMAQMYGDTLKSDGRLQLLVESLQDKGLRSGFNALRALGLVTARETMAVAIENLRSRNPAQRANALETLEAVGEREIIRPLLSLWETGDSSRAPLSESGLLDVLNDADAWLRACAVMVAAQVGDAGLREKLQSMCLSDPDEIVRAVAENVLLGEPAMDTMATLSLMERILFLRRVPLFADLPPADLKQVAGISSEVLFLDGQVIARQGEPGLELFILVSGEVRVLMSTANQSEPREVARRRAGEYVGEMAILGQEPRMATLIADRAVRALCIRQKQFEGILRERPETSLAMMRILIQRLKEASEQAVVRSALP
jgi:HEAT repeat protein